MILGFELTLLIYASLAGLFRLLWGVSPRAALSMLCVAGAGLIAVANPLLALYLAAQVLWVLCLYALCRRFPGHATWLSWLSFLGLIPYNMAIWIDGTPVLPALRDTLQGGSLPLVGWTVGATFFVVKSFVGLREALREGQLRPLPLLAGLTFLPAFPAGPIFGNQPFRPERIADLLPLRSLGIAAMKLGWGTAALYVIAPALRAEAAGNGTGILPTVADVYLLFAALFFDFSGYSLIAIALAAFFGVTLPENFNRPYLATSIREFWQRWHMSLSAFIATYLFKPYVRHTGAPRQGIFLAFIAVGLWHEMTPKYLLWGIGHGAALSLAMKPPRLWSRTMARLPGWLSAGIRWALTMTWVALLSYIASDFLWRNT